MQRRPGTEPENALTVGQLASQIKRVIEVDPILCDVAVQGEISNFKAHSSGHLYFTLKDDNAQLRAVMWRTRLTGLSFRPSDGDRVVATGNVEFYSARGDVSLICRSLRFAGQGALWEALQRIKDALAAEGLFDVARKRSLPPMPRVIGLITSPTGAVAHDVISVLRRRWPAARLIFIPAKVQGYDAAADLCRALSWAASIDELDVLIIGRGGGSAEDLWAFNDEELARAAAAFPKPLISAVGHETDFTILDFVADMRAPTPSAAAELAAPDVREVQQSLAGLRRRLFRAASGEISAARHQLGIARNRRVLTHPQERLVPLRQQVAAMRSTAQNTVARRVRIERQLMDARRGQLRALDPRLVLARGYAMVETQGGRLLPGAQAARRDEALNIVMHDGSFGARVE